MSGVPITVNALPVVTLTANDAIPVWDTESGIQGRVAYSTLLGLLGALYASLGANTFTGAQTIAAGDLALSALDNGTGEGRRVLVERNNNATTAAPGVLVMRTASGSFRWLYWDNSGIVRIHSTSVTSGEIANGTVVGSQTSSLDAKDVLEGGATIEEVLAAIAEGAAAVRKFVYKAPLEAVYDDNGNATGEYVEGVRPYGGEEFEGLIVDYAPRYGMDRDPTHPAGKSLNSSTVTGDLLRAVDHLAGRVVLLEERLETVVNGVQAALADFESRQGGT